MTLNIVEDQPLAPHTTFKIGGPAKFFCAAENLEQLTEAVTWAKQQAVALLIIGGGSNMLVHDNGFPGLAIQWNNKGVTVRETEAEVELTVAAGEIWDDLVKHTVDKDWWGIENLSHIPGKTGALAVQNVGAYGQEASQVVKSVEVLDVDSLTVRTFTNDQCQFDYRHSIFNTEQKNRYIIISTTLVLSKQARPNLSYGSLKKYLSEKEIGEPTQLQIREAVTAIRDRSFPFPVEAVNGNAGSFFRGPVLHQQQIEYLFQKVGTNFGSAALKRLHELTDKLLVPQGMKTPSAFLIELCGLKGFQLGNAKVHDNHAAIVINATGKATAQEITALFTHVGRIVYRQTGVILHIEPELVGYSAAEKEDILESVME
jgi:UDP-N-acetylmuramate dehydrogenase